MMKAQLLALRIMGHVAVPTAVVVASSALVACADENDPKTWVKRLDDPATRAPAIKRLEQFFNDAMSNAGNNRDDAKVKAVRDEAAAPLAKTYVTGGLDEKTRMELIKLLGDMGDERAAPAFVKAFQDFEPGKNDNDLVSAAEGTTRLAQAGKLTDQALVDALWDAFSKFQLSKNTKSVKPKDSLMAAVKAAKHPSYGPKAVALLSKPAGKADDVGDKMDFMFWQTTAAQLIGDLRFTAGINQLVTVLMTPQKREIALPVRRSLQLMAKDAEPVLIQALKGEGSFSELAKGYQEKGYMPLVAEPLAYIGRPAGNAAVLDALASAETDQNRVMLANYLTYWPTDAKNIQAFKDAAAKVKMDAVIPAIGVNGHAALAGGAAQFFDPSLTDWVLKEANTAKGEGVAEPIQSAAAISSIKLMTSEQSKSVNDMLNDKIKGAATEKDMFKAAQGVLDKCKKDVGCFLSVLDTPVPSSPPAAKMGHVKAVWMVASVGTPGDKAKVYSYIEKVKDRSVRLPLCEALDHLSPQGDKDLGDKLEKLVESEIAANNKDGTDEMYRIALKLKSKVP